jgi:hypothetical protein
MKKLYSVVLLFFIFRFSGHAQFVTQYFDGADTVFNNSVNVEIDTAGGNNIWQIGPPQKAYFDSAASQPNVIVTDTINYYPPDNVSTFTCKILNQFGSWGIYALQWSQMLDMDPGKDGGIVEFTRDYGQTWENIFNNPYVYNFYGYMWANADTIDSLVYAFSGRDTLWRDIWLCFDISWMTTLPDTIEFRFTFKSDSVGTDYEGWMIDNFISHPTFVHTVKENDLPDYVNLFPNPASKLVTIELQKQKDFHIIERMELVNSEGKTVKQWKNLPVKFWFDTTAFSDGLYYLNIKTNLRSQTVPLIISNN